MIDSSNNYQVQIGVNINSNIGESFIISNMRTKSKFICLSTCNSNKECLTAVYIESVENDNCILYKKHFNSTEKTTSSNTIYWFELHSAKQTNLLFILLLFIMKLAPKFEITFTPF